MKLVSVKAGTLKVGDRVLSGLKHQFQAEVVIRDVDDLGFSGAIVCKSCNAIGEMGQCEFLYFFDPNDDVTVEVEE